MVTTTLVLVFHPRLAQSRANRTLMNAAASVEGVTVVDVHAQYPDGRLDVEQEVQRLLAADRVVLQFPVQWYAVPALLKTWLDEVLTRMYYIHPDTEGARMVGTPLLVAATAGNVPDAYSPSGGNLYPLEMLLRPLEATAHRCGLPYAKPFLVYRANRLDDVEMAAQAERYRDTLGQWMAG